jgi:1-pyrroline-5-carboxylate dehydrogenase
LGHAAHATRPDAAQAIDAALAAAPGWAELGFEQRAAVFLRAADLLAGPWRDTVNVTTMLGQGKTIQQAEIDAACELIDFWRFNVAFARQILADQPISSLGVWNRADYRPLEGFVYAITPFNFTSIAGNLPTSPAPLHRLDEDLSASVAKRRRRHSRLSHLSQARGRDRRQRLRGRSYRRES